MVTKARARKCSVCFNDSRDCIFNMSQSEEDGGEGDSGTPGQPVGKVGVMEVGA